MENVGVSSIYDANSCRFWVVDTDGVENHETIRLWRY